MTPYETLKNRLSELKDLESAIGLMSWDKEIHLPKGAASRRAGQMATLSALHHQSFVEETPSLLAAAEASEGLSELEKANLKGIRRDLERMQKLPTEHVKATSLATSECFHAWLKAKEAADFSLYEAPLSNMVNLMRQRAEYLGYAENPYDALLDNYEPGITASEIEAVFNPLKAELGKLVPGISTAPVPDAEFLNQSVSKEAQMAFGKKVAGQLGYDFTHGRLDLSAHPFTISFGPEDVRITTLVKEFDIMAMLYSTIHEAGHGIYEQGLSTTSYGLPQGEACSLSIHESQSRLFENNISRSKDFWNHWFPTFAALYPDKLAGRSADDLFRVVNAIQPSLIRIYADELTYHFHIILRFEIENALINKAIEVKDLPAIWNEKIKNYLGLDVPDDGQGVLQDIHWAHGLFGYFPTYSLGSMYAAQFLHAAHQAIPGLKGSLAKGDYSPLVSWLQENIYQHGKLKTSQELCSEISGEPLNARYFIDYIKNKITEVYALTL